MGISLNSNPAGGCANIIDESPIIGIDTEMLIEMSKEVSISTPHEKLNFLVFPIITYLLRVIQLFLCKYEEIVYFLNA